MCVSATRWQAKTVQQHQKQGLEQQGWGDAGHRHSWEMSVWGAAVQEEPGGAGDSSLELHALVTTKMNCILGCICISTWSKEGILPLYLDWL